MADKTIGELPGISYLDAGSLFVAEQSGQAVKVSGKQLTDFSNVETTAQVEQAKASAQEAKTAQAAAEAAILKGPIIQNGTWWVYNQSAGAYQNTGINATGPKGDTGPTSSVNGISPDASGNITLTAGNVGAYSKSESDTLLAKKAPAGYGYGEQLRYVEGSENGLEQIFNEILSTMPDKSTKQIAFTCSDGTLYAQGTFTATICKDDSNYAFVIATTYNKNYTVKKSRFNGVWYPFEWENPPMLLDKEYRTTERYMGTPVFVRLVDCGTFTASASPTEAYTVVDTVANMGANFRLISCEGVQYITTLDQSTLPRVTDTTPCYIRAGCWTDSQNIRQWGVVVYFEKFTEPYHVYAIVKYTR